MEYKDFTIKAKLNDSGAMERRLMTMNATYVGLDHQTDYYFETASGKMKLRQGTIENLITHYERAVQNGAEKTIVYRYDESPTDESIRELKLNRRQIDVVRKERKIYLIDNVKIHIDKLPGGQCFIEVEVSDRANVVSDDDLKDQCLTMKSRLGISDADLVKTGYLKEG